jgi:AcrR family transcriptional regulator
MAVVANKRVLQKQQTRDKILAALVASLVEVGYAKTTTVEVQRRAGISRGALLHHFPTRVDLFEAAIGYVVARNEASVRAVIASSPPGRDPIARAVQALATAMAGPAHTAELELWAAARTDAELRVVLRKAETAARKDLRRVSELVFGTPWTELPRFQLVSELTIAMLRGLAMTRALRSDPFRHATLVAAWSRLATELLERT